MSKNIPKFIIIFAIAIISLFILTVAFFTSSPGENIIKSKIAGVISENAGLAAEIGKFETDLFSRIRVDDLVVFPGHSANQDTILYINKIKITYSIFDLLAGGIKLKSAIIDGSKIFISADSLGNYGIPLLDKTEEPDSTGEETRASFSVDSVALIGINASYSDRRLPVDLDLYDLKSEIYGYKNGGYGGHVTADSIITRYENDSICISDIVCDFSPAEDGLAVSFGAVLEGMTLAAETSLESMSLDEFTFHASLEGGPSGILNILNNKYRTPQLSINNIRVDVDAEGSMEQPEIALSISAPEGSVENIVLESFRLNALYSQGLVYIDTLIVESLGGFIELSGSLTLNGSNSVDAILNIEGIDLSELWPAIYEHDSPFEGRVAGTVRAKGKADNIAGWEIDGKLDFTKLRYMSRPAGRLDLDFSLRDHLARLRFVHEEDTVVTSAVLKNGNIEGRFHANIPKVSSISRFADIPDLEGSITAQGEYSGKLEAPVIYAVINGYNISYQNFPVDTLAADIQYAGKSTIINHLKLSGKQLINPLENRLFGLDSLYGEFEYEFEARGSMDYLEGGISARAASLRYAGNEIDSAYVSAEIDGSIISLEDLDIYSGGLALNSSGSFDTTTAKGNLVTKIYSIGTDVEEDEDIKPLLNNELINRGVVTSGIELSGKDEIALDIKGDGIRTGILKSFTNAEVPESGFLNFDLAFRGNYFHPKASLRVTAYSLSHGFYDIDSVLVGAVLNDDHLQVTDFELFADDNDLSARGEIYFDRNPDNSLIITRESVVSGALKMNKLDLSILKPYAIPEGELIGTASAFIAWDGILKDPGIEGWIDILDGYIRFAESSSPLERIYLRMNLGDSMIVIDSGSCFSANTPLSIKGAAKYRFPDILEVSGSLGVYDRTLLSAEGEILKDSLDLKIFSDNFDLNILKPFMATADSMKGDLNSEASIAGNWATPRITGYLRISNFALYSSKLSVDFKDGFLNAGFDKTRIDLDSLYVNINGGSFAAKGYLEHDGKALTDINLGLKASGISYDKKGIFKGKLEFADLVYSRKEDQYYLDGDISLGESRLTARFSLKSILPWAQSVESVAYEFPDIIARTRLSVRFRENNNLWIDNNLANVRIKAEMSFIGTPSRPIPTGFARIEEGYLIYLDRRFEVEDGNVYSGDPLKFNPDISLHAKTTVTAYQRTVAEKYEIHIKVDGSLENPRADIYSIPPLDKPDIVALLTLGTTRSQMAGNNESQGGFKNALVERASRLTSDRVSGYLSEKMGSMFGFAEFTVEGNLFRFDDSWGPRLVASQRLTKRVELTYSTTVGHLNDQGVRLGYKLTPRISIQGETDQEGRSGIDLKYGVKFK